MFSSNLINCLFIQPFKRASVKEKKRFNYFNQENLASDNQCAICRLMMIKVGAAATRARGSLYVTKILSFRALLC